MLGLPVTCREYEYHCRLYQLPEQGLQPEPTPQWAEWFCRHILTDHWPAAEPLLATGPPEVRAGYEQFVKILRQCGMLGRSTGEHELAQIQTVPVQEAPPVPAGSWRGKRPADADAVAARVEQFRQQRKRAKP